MLDQINIELRSKSPMLHHAYRGMQPSAAKVKRGEKTQLVLDKALREDWERNAYWDKVRKTFFMPAENVEATLSHGARDFRQGAAFKASVYVMDEFIPLIVYSGPDDKKGKILTGELMDFYIPEYTDIRGVVIGRVRVDRCRPIFRHWGLKFTVAHDPSITAEEVNKALTSYRIGLGDFRPRFGRFEVVGFEIIKAAKAA